MSTGRSLPCSPTTPAIEPCPQVHQWLLDSGVPVLVVWGRNDEIFDIAGATAFRRDAPDARIELLDGGHFLLESHLDEVVRIIRDWRATVRTSL